MTLQLLHRPLGRADYQSTWDLQRALRARLLAEGGPDTLLTVEHPPVLTAGRRAAEEHLTTSRADLAARGVLLQAIERGGDWTYHGPGQLVAYPIVALRRRRLGARAFVGALQDTMRALGERAIAATGVSLPEGSLDVRCDAPGTWFVRPDGSTAKLGAVGVHISHGVTMHGFALNLDPEPWGFAWIVPCGLADEETTSLARVVVELGGDPSRLPSMESLAGWVPEVLGDALAARQRAPSASE
ncbi:MAG: lipoyl(octanoyl) transferase LipB [Deltaproteobacteria bacterium]|nr:lipoyl(octanoyl) transferase LipB [Deltaproteobacteria bacterium]